MRVCSTGIVTSASKMEASCRAVCLNRISMIQINRRELPLPKNLRRIRGRPTGYFAFDDKIKFWPVPDKPYKARVRYVPPVAEF